MARAGIQMQLGSFVFSIDTAGYEKLTRSSNWRWPAQNRIQRRVAHQFVGTGAESINISGYMHPEYKGRVYQMDDLRNEADNGNAMMLTSGTGKVFGRYCVESVKEDFSGVMDDHRARRVDFTVELKRYGEDGET